MTKPAGSLTAEQHQIMRVIWEAGDHGATVAEIRDRLAAIRARGRTTVLKQVQRLEQRGWLKRIEDQTIRYVAAASREDTAGNLAGNFVGEFFGGSLSNLVMSLLGSRKLDPAEIDRLKQLLDKPPDSPKDSP